MTDLLEHRSAAVGTRHLLGPAQDYIRAHLGDQGLYPAAVARHLGISVHALRRVFRGHAGTSVTRWILDQRLEAVRRDLADPAQAAVTVEAIAVRWGFTTKKAFLRRFRQVTGTTPTGYRRAHQSAAEPAKAA